VSTADRLARDLEALAAFGRDPAGGMTRLALTADDGRARAYVAEAMRELGLAVSHDEVGNLFGRRAGSAGNAGLDGPCVMTGSHLDSVPRGGRFDGPLGVVGALEALRALDAAGVANAHPIEVAVFVAEEGSRFGRGTIGSAALAGDVAAAEILALRDREGVSFGAALAAAYRDDPATTRPAARAPGSVRAFVELHIEQGGVLEARGLAIGAVTAVAGLVQLAVAVVGDANHAGATPMDLRRDALAGAAEIALAAEHIAGEVGGGAVATVGQLAVEPGAFNIIPGRAVLGIDARAPAQALLERLERELRAAAEAIAARRRLAVTIAVRQRVPAGPLAEKVIAAVERAAVAEGLGSLRMASGAIHDALHMASFCPAGMIFVPSRGGKSHCPEEESSLEAMHRGCAVLARTLAELASGGYSLA
jgi:allantoate deiminase